MKFESTLTNEGLKKEFDSQFEMVNYLIFQAQGMISSGRGPRVQSQSDNVAVNVVAEVVEGKDKDTLEVEEEFEVIGAEFNQEALETPKA